MINNLLNNFRLGSAKESPETVISIISDNVEFRGTNLWILVFAIFIASLGLNINSTAVIIGAMLISPLMGPIMGMGLGLGINDLVLVKRSVRNYSFAVVVSLITSFIYFSVSPLNDAYSELLSRTFPTIYDVLIAIFGGFAGILATSSRQKGNVVPGVAIATALMPPLCTAGYGLAHLNPSFFFGAIYLFTINTVFIALATFVTVRGLKFPLQHLHDAKAEKKAHRIIIAIAILTIIPSIYLGYLMVEQNRFNSKANYFAEVFTSFEGNFLLERKIDPNSKSITLIYVGREIQEKKIEEMKKQLEIFGLKGASLIIKQGFSNIKNSPESSSLLQLKQLLVNREEKIKTLLTELDSIKTFQTQAKQIFAELKTLYPVILSATLNPITIYNDSSSVEKLLIYIETKNKLPSKQKKMIENLMQARLNNKSILLLNNQK